MKRKTLSPKFCNMCFISDRKSSTLIEMVVWGDATDEIYVKRTREYRKSSWEFNNYDIIRNNTWCRWFHKSMDSMWYCNSLVDNLPPLYNHLIVRQFYSSKDIFNVRCIWCNWHWIYPNYYNILDCRLRYFNYNFNWTCSGGVFSEHPDW